MPDGSSSAAPVMNPGPMDLMVFLTLSFRLIAQVYGKSVHAALAHVHILVRILRFQCKERSHRDNAHNNCDYLDRTLLHISVLVEFRYEVGESDIDESSRR